MRRFFKCRHVFHPYALWRVYGWGLNPDVFSLSDEASGNTDVCSWSFGPVLNSVSYYAQNITLVWQCARLTVFPFGATFHRWLFNVSVIKAYDYLNMNQVFWLVPFKALHLQTMWAKYQSQSCRFIQSYLHLLSLTTTWSLSQLSSDSNPASNTYMK